MGQRNTTVGKGQKRPMSCMKLSRCRAMPEAQGSRNESTTRPGVARKRMRTCLEERTESTEGRDKPECSREREPQQPV